MIIKKIIKKNYTLYIHFFYFFIININIAVTLGNNPENSNLTISPDNPILNSETHDTSKLISTIIEYIPTFFSSNGVLTHEK